MADVANTGHGGHKADEMAHLSDQNRETTQDAAAPKSTRCFRQRNEVARVGDVLRYLAALKAVHPSTKLSIDDMHAIDFDTAINTAPVKQICPDKALISLGQLCALQFGVRSCQISMVCRRNEHVLVDVSHTTALQQRLGSPIGGSSTCDVGTTTFDRDQGFTHRAIDTWQSARRPRSLVESSAEVLHADGITPHSSVITDLRTASQQEEGLANRRLYQQMPWLRYIVSVPLRTAKGSVVGALTIMDDKPRPGVSDAQVGLLEELADTVMEHMHSIVVRAQQQRSQKLIQGLYLFNSGASSMRSWWQQQDDARVEQHGRNTIQSTQQERNERIDDEFGERTPPSAQTDAPLKARSADARPAVRLRHRAANHSDDNAQPSTADQISSAYNRATNLIREATGVSGTTILGLEPASLRPEDDSDNDSSSSSSDKLDKTADSKKYSTVHSYSTRQRSTTDGHTAASSQLRLPNASLQRLIKTYPNGAVFHLGADREVLLDSIEDSSSAGSSDAGRKLKQPRSYRHVTALAKAIKKVRSLAFVPLRESTADLCRSCALIWNESADTVIDAEQDLVYLRTFRNLIMAELARIHSVASETAKGRFLSTVSHEMRSPLHAILGGMEFLKDTELNDFQQDMATTVSQAGQTLLETVEHILDYSKISNTIRATSSDPRSKASEAARSPTIDVAKLTERTIETCVTAHRSQMQSLETHPPRDESHLTSSSSLDTHRYSAALSKESDVALILNIVPRLNWVMKMAPGAWTRIVTNLVGNALKYTHHGHISVRLEATPSDIIENAPGNTTEDLDPEVIITLIVEDTGIGMSQAFLTDGAFIPFKQQDPLSVGAGLGLSIVNQIANDIGATIELDTQEGRGTKLTIQFNTKLHHVNDNALGAQEAELNATSLRVDTFQVHVEADETTDAALDTSQIICESVLETAQAWMHAEPRKGMRVLETPAGNTRVSAITEHTLRTWQKTRPDELSDHLSQLSTYQSHILVLADNIRSVVPDPAVRDLPIRAVFVHQPIGPRKLLRAIATDRDSSEANPSSYDLTTPVEEMSPTGRDMAWHAALVRSTSTQAQQHSNRRPAAPLSTISSVSSHAETAGATASASADTSALTDAEDAPDAALQTVLLVEDNPLNMRLLVTMARKLNVPYRCAYNGQEALNIYQSEHAVLSLVLTDISMPVMDGFAATRAIRDYERSHKLSRVYIAALTGVTDADAKNAAFACGVDDFFSKPVTMQELKSLLHRARKSSLQASLIDQQD